MRKTSNKLNKNEDQEKNEHFRVFPMNGNNLQQKAGILTSARFVLYEVIKGPV